MWEPQGWKSIKEVNNLCSFYRIQWEEPRFNKLNVCSELMMNKIKLEMYAVISRIQGIKEKLSI